MKKRPSSSPVLVTEDSGPSSASTSTATFSCQSKENEQYDSYESDSDSELNQSIGSNLSHFDAELSDY